MRLVKTVCPHDCPDACAMVATVEHGRVTQVRGNPAHPFTRGVLCAKLRDFEARTYAEDRVVRPLKRVGPKGARAFEPIGWDEALDTIHERLSAIIAESGPQAILPCSFLGTQGALNGLNVGDAFFNRLGASIAERTICNSGAAAAQAMVIGPTVGLDPEAFVHARLIVLWACNAIETSLHHWPFIAEARRRGATLVVVDPARSRTAADADWHIAPLPGSDAALALGLIHVLFEDGLTDDAYIADHTSGVEALRARAAGFPPERVAVLTGLAADEVRRLARLYASARPAAIRLGVAIERQANGGSAVRAIASLPALVGAWRERGGGFLQMTAYAFPADRAARSRPDWIRPDTRVVNQWQLGRALGGELGLDPPVRALFVYNANPLVTLPQQDRVRSGLAREDLFTVVSEQVLTDTAAYADIVLPAATQLEQFDLAWSWGHLYLGLNAAATAPRGDAVSNAELFRRLARRFGFDDPHWARADEAMAFGQFDWSQPALAGLDRSALRGTGFARLSLPSPDEWAPHADGGFPTPSARCEFVARPGAGAVGPSLRQGLVDSDPDPIEPLPGYRPPESDPRFPLRLLTRKQRAFLNSTYGGSARHRRMAGRPRLSMHADDAAVRGIADGDAVAIRSATGALRTTASLDGLCRQGVVALPFGDWLNESGATASALLSDAFADLGRAPTFSDTRVEVAAIPLSADISFQKETAPCD